MGAKYTYEVIYTMENITEAEKAAITECLIYFCERQYTGNDITANQYPQFTKSQELLFDDEKVYDKSSGPLPLTPPNGTRSLSDNSTYAIDIDSFRGLQGTLNNFLNSSLDRPSRGFDASNVLFSSDSIN